MNEMHKLFMVKGFIDAQQKHASLLALPGASGGALLETGKGLLDRAVAAVKPYASSRAVGLGVGLGGTLGAVGGAAHEGYKNYRDIKEQGGSTGDAAAGAALGGIGGAFGGLSKGMLAGGAIGAGVHKLRPNAVPNLLKGGEGSTLERLTHFGQRQLHSLTGFTPETAENLGHTEAVRHIGGGARYAIDALNNIEKGLKENPNNPDLLKQLPHALNTKRLAEEAESKGLTSVPGYVRGLAPGRALDTLSTGLRETWHGAGGGFGKAMLMSGIPLTGMEVYQAAKGEPDPEGLSRGERIGKSVGGLLGTAVGTPLAMSGQNVLQRALTTGGRLVGGAADLGIRAGHRLYDAIHPSQPGTAGTTP